MIEQHTDDSAVITGASTHNERIERLWHDVTRCAGIVFADIFRELEEEGRLDALNEVDLYCLHYVYKARMHCKLLLSLRTTIVFQLKEDIRYSSKAT